MYDGRVRRILPALAAALAAACATSAPDRPADAALPTTRAVQLARVRCLLVAPLENASDEPLVAEAATGALVSAIDANRTRIYPIEDLRGLFKDTPLELPEGVSASLALELGELVAADAVLYGSVEGRARGPEAEVTLTVRLAATGVRDTLFSRAVRVEPRAGESLVDASRRSALEAAAPMLERIGVPGRKVCFERQRLDRVRLLALAGEKPPAAANRVTAPLPPPPPPVPGAAIAAEVAPAPAVPDARAPASPATAAGAALAATATVPGAAAPAPSPAAAPMDVEIVSGSNVLPTLRARQAGQEVASLEPTPPAPPVRSLNRRQQAWAEKLAARERFVVEDVTFVGRSPRFERQSGLVDLAAALGAQRDARVRVEGFVDAGPDAARGRARLDGARPRGGAEARRARRVPGSRDVGGARARRAHRAELHDPRPGREPTDRGGGRPLSVGRDSTSIDEPRHPGSRRTHVRMNVHGNTVTTSASE